MSSEQNVGRLMVRQDIPDSTDLHKAPFAILGVSTRDNRRRILEQAEERSLTLDHDQCISARSDLINPRVRLSAEVAWLPGISPQRATAYCTLLRQDLTKYISAAEGESPLVKSNLLAAALDLFDADMGSGGWTALIHQLAADSDQIVAEDVLRLINEDRAVAGFPLVTGLELVEEEISNRRRYYKDSIKDAIDRLPTKRMIEVMTAVVDEATLSGAVSAPLVLDELVDSYELGARSFLDQEGANVLSLVSSIRKSAGDGAGAVTPLIAKLDMVLRNWTRVAKPVQVSMKSRGLEHTQSRELAMSIRSIGVDLFNEHRMLDQAERITDLLKDVFSELPEVASRLQEDSAAIADLHRDRQLEKERAEDWGREITYETQIGFVFKDTLKISPKGLEWRGSRIELDKVTGIGWGGTRNSVNGIPTGTDFVIFWRAQNAVTRVQLSREDAYLAFIEKLWKAVGVRLLTEMLSALREGKTFRFGDAVLSDYGLELTKGHLFSADERIKATWAELQMGSVNGALSIFKIDDRKAALTLPYQAANNAHILEAAIRMKFKSGDPRLSSLLKG